MAVSKNFRVRVAGLGCGLRAASFAGPSLGDKSKKKWRQNSSKIQKRAKQEILELK